MSDYSESQNSFDGIRLSHIAVLLDVLQQSDVRETEYVRRRYTERATYFEPVLRFANKLGIVRDGGSTLSINDGLAGRIATELADVVIERLFQRRTEYRANLISYLRQFRPESDHVVYRPSPDRRSMESAMRNFLIDLGVVAHDPLNDCYTIEPDRLVAYAKAFSSGSRSPKSYIAEQQARTELGYSAELAVVRFEQDRVGPKYAPRIEHVSTTNDFAGYDIESITISPAGPILPRFIEVKAVSFGTFGFYWSVNEISVAQMLGTWYYMYLLPVDENGQFAIDAIRIINDPASTVLESPDRWNVQPTLFRCEPTDGIVGQEPL